MKFLTYILTFIFSFQAQAHDDHFLGEGIAHEVIHIVLLFLLVAVVATGFKWFKNKSKQLKNESET
tara:strand:- start:716 stop:913 length:198 start_codon:yes stop_codon:yes gene_type:complete